MTDETGEITQLRDLFQRINEGINEKNLECVVKLKPIKKTGDKKRKEEFLDITFREPIPTDEFPKKVRETALGFKVDLGKQKIILHLDSLYSVVLNFGGNQTSGIEMPDPKGSQILIEGFNMSNTEVSNDKVAIIKKFLELGIMESGQNIMYEKRGRFAFAINTYLDSDNIFFDPIHYIKIDGEDKINQLKMILEDAERTKKEIVHCKVYTKKHAIVMSFSVKECLEKLRNTSVEKFLPGKDFLISDSSGAIFSEKSKGKFVSSFKNVFSLEILDVDLENSALYDGIFRTTNALDTLSERIKNKSREKVKKFREACDPYFNCKEKQLSQKGPNCYFFSRCLFKTLTSPSYSNYSLERIMHEKELITLEAASRTEHERLKIQNPTQQTCIIKKIDDYEQPSEGYVKVNFDESSFLINKDSSSGIAVKNVHEHLGSRIELGYGKKEFDDLIKNKNGSGTVILTYDPDISLVMLKKDNKVIYFNKEKAESFVKNLAEKFDKTAFGEEDLKSYLSLVEKGKLELDSASLMEYENKLYESKIKKLKLEQLELKSEFNKLMKLRPRFVPSGRKPEERNMQKHIESLKLLNESRKKIKDNNQEIASTNRISNYWQQRILTEKNRKQKQVKVQL